MEAAKSDQSYSYHSINVIKMIKSQITRVTLHYVNKIIAYLSHLDNVLNLMYFNLIIGSPNKTSKNIVS